MPTSLPPTTPSSPRLQDFSATFKQTTAQAAAAHPHRLPTDHRNAQTSSFFGAGQHNPKQATTAHPQPLQHSTNSFLAFTSLALAFLPPRPSLLRSLAFLPPRSSLLISLVSSVLFFLSLLPFLILRDDFVMDKHERQDCLRQRCSQQTQKTASYHWFTPLLDIYRANRALKGNTPNPPLPVSPTLKPPPKTADPKQANSGNKLSHPLKTTS